MAAEHGHAEAQNSLGSGLQAEKRYEEALPWYEKASAQGHALATNNLAYLYDLGLGVQQDRRKGFELYSRAADLGWAEAMWNIANMYGAGQLGEKDMASACIWALRAREFAGPNDRRLLNYVNQAVPYLERSLSAAQLKSCKEQAKAWSPSGPQAGNGPQSSVVDDAALKGASPRASQ
jgi:TPR repeat protein